MEVTETRPSGNGNLQKWAALVVHFAKEHRFKCYMNHEGLPESITLRWVKDLKPPKPTVPFMPTVIIVVLRALLMGTEMSFLIRKRRTRG